MEIENIIEQSCRYPFSDMKEFLRVIALFVLLLVPAFLGALFLMSSHDVGANIAILIIMAILFIVIGLLISGYFISVMKEGINQSGIIPSWNIKKNIVDGLKFCVLAFVYSIIPLVFMFIFMIGASGLFVFTNSAASAIIAGFVLLILIVVILIFTILSNVGALRLANTDSLSEGLNFSAVIEDLKQIGIIKYVITFIMFAIISGIIGLVGSFISLIPYIGGFIYLLFLLPIAYSISAYGYGLLYSDVA